ncbi:MAG: hypothetical protein MSA50_09935 [Veillonellaceae bacterium]|nr:hypothetical protein [Veillonellaceae bacterium]
MQRFADMCGFSKAYIGQLEKGINPKTKKPMSPTMQTFTKIANSVGMSVDQLLEKLDDDQPVSISKSTSAAPAPAEPPAGLTARDERDIERFDPVKAIFDDSDVRSLARDRLKGVSKEEIALRKQQLKAMVAAMWMKEENEK